MRRFFTICLLLTALHSSPDAHADDITELRARADQGHADAQFILGDMSASHRGAADRAPDGLYLMAKRSGMSRKQSAQYLQNFAEKVIPAVQDL